MLQYPIISRLALVIPLLCLAEDSFAARWFLSHAKDQWFRTLYAVCDAHRASVQAAYDNKTESSVWHRRRIYTCDETRVIISGNSTSYHYILRAHSADSWKWRSTLEYGTPSKECEDGSKPSLIAPHHCTRPTDDNAGQQDCPNADSGNPINPLVGNKFQSFRDIMFRGPSDIHFQRFYNSLFKRQTLEGGFGWQWTHSYNKYLFHSNLNGDNTVELTQGDGKRITFKHTGQQWENNESLRLTEVIDADTSQLQEWVIDNKVSRETYNANGKLVSIVNLKTNKEVRLVYDDDTSSNAYKKLLRIEDDYGNHITFSYLIGGNIETITTSSDEVYEYRYSGTDLSQVIFPDGTSEEYFYESDVHSRLLTAMSNRNGHRFAEWGYDQDYRAIFSQHLTTDGTIVDRTEIDYSHIDDVDAPRVTVTNALGKKTTYHYAVVNNKNRVISVDGHATSNCAAANKNYTYYNNGLIETKTDWSGNVTAFEYNERGLVTKKVEAQGSSEERTTLTTWHPDKNLPTHIDEPDRVTVITYDSNGLVLNKKITPKN